MQGFLLWVAQGFGVGRFPFGPGTLGSLVGLLWLGVLLKLGGPTGFFLGAIVGVGLSVWLCGLAEAWLKQHDPPSVVLDEIVAVPFCYLPMVWHAWLGQESWLGLEQLFQRSTWPATLAVFAAFRLFDIAKPWPVKQSQRLPGGWGVTADDLLAAAYTALLGCVALALHTWRGT